MTGRTARGARSRCLHRGDALRVAAGSRRRSRRHRMAQAKLDAGGSLVLPRLPNGECYETRGLWVSHDDTTVTSDGACVVALGPGEGRIPRGDGTFVRANAVFFVDHSDVRKPLPVRISISGLHLTVPAATRMHGISVLGHEVTLSGLAIDGAPLTDVRIGAGHEGLRRNVGPRRAHRLVALGRPARRRLDLRCRGAARRRQSPLRCTRAAGPPACISGRPIAASRHSTCTLPGTRSSATQAPGSSWTSRRRTAYPSSHRESSSSATSSSGMRGRPRLTAAPAS